MSVSFNATLFHVKQWAAVDAVVSRYRLVMPAHCVQARRSVSRETVALEANVLVRACVGADPGALA